MCICVQLMLGAAAGGGAGGPGAHKDKDSAAGIGIAGHMGTSGGDGSEGDMNAAFATWLRSQFVEQGDMDARFAALTDRIGDQVKEQAGNIAAVVVAAKAAELAATAKEEEKSQRAGAGVSIGSGAGALLMADGSMGLTEDVSVIVLVVK